MLQNVDTPVPHGGRGASGDLQGFLPRFSAPVEQTVHIPAPRSGVRRLQGVLPEKSVTAFGEADYRSPAASVEQIVDNPGFGGGLQDLRPGQGSASSSHSPADFADDANQGDFRTFPQNKKKCDSTSALGVGTTSALEPMDAGCLWRPHEEEESKDESDFDVEYVEHDGRWWGCESVPARQQYC